MDFETIREFLNSSQGGAFLVYLEHYQKLAEDNVIRQTQASIWCPDKVRFQAGVAAGHAQLLAAIQQLRKDDHDG